MSILNDRIKKRRIAIGKTLLEIADALNVKEATVQRYESGAIKNIKHETIVALAEILQCSPAYLMGWEDTLYSAATSSVVLTSEETDLILKFRSFNDEGKEKVVTYISDFDRAGIYKNNDKSEMVSEKA